MSRRVIHLLSLSPHSRVCFFLGVISLHRKFLFLWQLICSVINDPVKMGRNEFLCKMCGLLWCIVVNNVSKVCYKEKIARQLEDANSTK
jgi:hypothetical protein